MYGDCPYVEVNNLRKPGYYKKKTIEGTHQSQLRQSISLNGVKRPLVINEYPDREGVIIDGVETWKISKELNIVDLPVYVLNVPEEKEREIHYLLSIKCNEYHQTDIEAVIEKLKAPYEGYFDKLPKLLEPEFEPIDLDLKANDLNNIQLRKHTFPLRLDEQYKEYPEKLQQLIGAKSRNEAIVKLIVLAVEGGIAL